MRQTLREVGRETYDEWIKESFTSLKKLLPARYGKDEGGMTIDNEIY